MTNPREKHREYMRLWRQGPKGRAAAERRPRKTGRRVKFWNRQCS